MKIMNVRRFNVMAVALAVTLALILTWGYQDSDKADAANTGAKTQMDLVINDGQCDSSVQTKCTLAFGSTFTLSIVPSILPDAAGGGYTGWQTLLDYGTLLYKPASGEITWDVSLLPGRSPGSPTGKEGQVGHGDTSAFFGTFPVSQQKTAIVTLGFNCAQNNQSGIFSETVSLIDFNASPSGTTYVEVDYVTVDVPNVGSLEINCVVMLPTNTPKPPPTNTPQPPPTDTPAAPPVGGIAVDPDLGALALATGASSSNNTGLLAGIVAAAGVVALGGAAWYARRRAAGGRC